jgi:hypothetical protein
MKDLRSRLRRFTIAATSLGLATMFYGGCKEVKDKVEDTFGTDITGLVNDDKGQPVEGASVRLFTLTGNTDFVEGGDLGSGEAYIDREKVLASTNSVDRGTTGADGRFKLKAIPNAFLAVVTKAGCSAGFAGFNEETGVLSLNTLIAPNFSGGLNFEVPTFVIACASPPPTTEPGGNTPEAPPYEPPAPTPTCDMTACTTAGGTCQGTTCVVTCVAADCTAAGGTCTDGVCVTPTCDPAACQAAGGACSGDGLSCQLPKCTSNDDCQIAGPGWVCVNPGDVELANCQPPEPGGPIPPTPVVSGWVEVRLTDTAGQPILDASMADQSLVATSIPANGLVRLYARYMGAATKGYVLIQNGSADCAAAPPHTDTIAMDLSDQQVATAKGDFIELYLHKGYQKIQLSTSETIGEGERSHAIEVGAGCVPRSPFSATLTWDAGKGQPVDLDLNVWNKDGELVFVGQKQASWGQLMCHGKGPGPEVFESTDVLQGPFTIKVSFFAGKPREVKGKLRITRSVGGKPLDESFTFTVDRPKAVAEIGVFASK